jgi:hypothetical protein
MALRTRVGSEVHRITVAAALQHARAFSSSGSWKWNSRCGKCDALAWLAFFYRSDWASSPAGEAATGQRGRWPAGASTISSFTSVHVTPVGRNRAETSEEQDVHATTSWLVLVAVAAPWGEQGSTYRPVAAVLCWARKHFAQIITAPLKPVVSAQRRRGGHVFLCHSREHARCISTTVSCTWCLTGQTSVMMDGVTLFVTVLGFPTTLSVMSFYFLGGRQVWSTQI